jgi:hypothetical protein
MKIIAKALILGSLLISGTAFAQAVAVLPTIPNPPKIIATSPNELDATSVATTNKVYINQSGDNVNVNIQQTGAADTIGTLDDPIYLRGDNQTVTVIQTGKTNSILMGIVGDFGSGAGTIATLQQLGNNNSIDIRCGTYANDPSCNGLNLNDRFNGNNNALIFHGNAANITQTIDTNGDNNKYVITVSSPNSSQNLYVTGDFNKINATQTDLAGTYGHSLVANILGTNNNLTTQQYGPSETAINVQMIGSNGNVQIKTGH